MRFLPKLLPLLLISLLPAVAGAQTPSLSASCPRVPVPFGPGEEATYDIRTGPFRGEGRLGVVALDTLRGHPTYRLEMYLDASLGIFGRLTNDSKSWLDTEALVSRRYTRDGVELRTQRKRFYEIFPEERRWEQTLSGERGGAITSCPLDDLSFIYYLRTLPLIPGETLTLNRYFKEDGNPVRVEVARRDSIEVPAGKFNTIVVRPIIKTSGLFGEGGKAEVHFSDDQYRDMVYLRIDLPVGSMSLYLKNVRRATPGS